MSFISTIQNNFYNYLFIELHSYVFNHRESIEIPSRRKGRILSIKLDDFTIKKMLASNLVNGLIESDLKVMAHLAVRVQTKFDVELDNADIQLFVRIRYHLENGLSQLEILQIKSYVHSNEKGPIPYFSTEFVPYIRAKDMDKIAESILEAYCPDMLVSPMGLPIYDFAEKLGVVIEEGTLSKDGSIFGEMVFKDSLVTFFENDQEVKRMMPGGTVLVDPQVKGLRNQGSYNNTIIHECVHWLLHRTHHEYKSLFGSQELKISSRIHRPAFKEGQWNTYDWMEWQANGIAARILMPQKTTKMMVQKLVRKHSLKFDPADRVEMLKKVIDDLAHCFHVSRWAVKIRLMQLGYTEFEGIYKYMGHQYVKSYTFEANAIQNNQTFTISFQNACHLNFHNDRFREVMDSGRYVYVDSHFCLNSEKYVKMLEPGVYQMTEYAYSHMDECCLVFDIHYKGKRSISPKDFNDYILYRGNLPELNIELDFSEHLIEIRSLPEYTGQIFPEIMRIMATLPNHFCGTMRSHRDRKHCSQEKLVEHSGLSISTIARMETQHDNVNKIENIVAVCIALKLYPDFSFDLIEKSNCRFNNQVPHHSAYKMILRNCYHLSLEEVNQLLSSMDVKTI